MNELHARFMNEILAHALGVAIARQGTVGPKEIENLVAMADHAAKSVMKRAGLPVIEIPPMRVP